VTVAEAHALTLEEAKFLDAHDFWARVAFKAGMSVKRARAAASALGLGSPPSQRHKNHRFCRS